MMLARGNLIVEVLEAETELKKNPFVRRNTRGIHSSHDVTHKNSIPYVSFGSTKRYIRKKSEILVNIWRQKALDEQLSF